MNKGQFTHAIERARLGALADEGEPIGDCLAIISRYWRGRDADIEIPKDLGERIWDALGELNRNYDDNGYTIDGPGAHAATHALCDVLDDVVTVLDRISIVRDTDEEKRPTYTLVTATSPGGVTILIGSPPDGDQAAIEWAIAGHREMERENRMGADEEDREAARYAPAKIELIPGCILTDDEPEDEDRIVWRGHETGWLIDENSNTYEYAIRP
jgi:hypothetical protein